MPGAGVDLAVVLNEGGGRWTQGSLETIASIVAACGHLRVRPRPLKLHVKSTE